MELLEGRVLMSAVTVMSTGDNPSSPDAGTLRWAIGQVNLGLANEIDFSVGASGSQQVISLNAALPAITSTSQVTIDGTTQGASASPLIEITASSTGLAGLEVDAPAVIHGLAFTGFTGGAGLHLGGGSAVTSSSEIFDNYFGTNSAGAVNGNNVGLQVDQNAVAIHNNVVVNSTLQGILDSGSNVAIWGNTIGVDPTQTTAMPNQLYGIEVDSASFVQIGGADAAHANVIAYNDRAGVLVEGGTSVGVQGNMIGVNSAGTVPMGNQGDGVEVDQGTQVSVLNNFIAGNDGNGILISHSTNDQIQGNVIGLDGNGTITTQEDASLFVNNGDGVRIGSASSSIAVGGTDALNASSTTRNIVANSLGSDIAVVADAGDHNVISGNFLGTDATGLVAFPSGANGAILNGSGVLLEGNLLSGSVNGAGVFVTGSNNTIQNNLIGTTPDGTQSDGNGDGVIISNGFNNHVVGNTIAFNGYSGVTVQGFSGNGNNIQGNSIFANASIGIDLGYDGVTPNDSQDHSSGPNNWQDMPVITSITNDGQHLTIKGTISFAAAAGYTIDFYADAAADPSQAQYGQGKEWLGSTSVAMGSDGTFTAVVALPSASDLNVVSATATVTSTNDTTDFAVGNTSEFSLDVAVPAAPVNQAVSTSMTLNSSLNPSEFGQSVTFTAQVASQQATGHPFTGTVNFFDNGVQLNATPITVDPSTGIATFSTSSLALGSHGDIYAVYSGDANYVGSTSPVLVETIYANTTGVLTSLTNPSVFGQTVTFDATVAANEAGAGVPTGYVILLDGSSQIGAPMLLSGGAAEWNLSGLTVGSHAFSVFYMGDSTVDYVSTTSNTVAQNVQKDGTSVTISSSEPTSNYGDLVTFTATVSVTAPGTATPTGAVSFYDGSTFLGTTNLLGNVATFSTSSLAAGVSHSITAMYNGDADCLSSTSAPIAQNVNAAATSATLMSSANPSVYGQAVTITATLTSSAGTPTGSVTLVEDGTAVSNNPMTLDAGGHAAWTFNALSLGDHSFTVSYAGQGSFAPTTSSALDQKVNQAGTQTTLTSLVGSTVYGNTVTFTAQVTVLGPGGGTPGGQVQFFDGHNSMGFGTLDANGYATFSISTLNPGNHTITAQYLGSTNYLSSTSNALTQTVGLDASQTALRASNSTVALGDTFTIYATVSDLSLISYIPTGAVTFFEDGTQVGGAMTLDASGMASIVLSGAVVGNHTITAAYNGDTYVAGSTASPLTESVTRAASTTGLSTNVNPSVYGQAVTLTATVGGAFGTPSGSVTFLDGSTQIGSATLDATGHATLVVSNFAVGGHSLSVSYAGDSNYLSSSSSPMTETVNLASTKLSLASSANPSNVGQAVTFTATVSVVAPGAGTLSGVVTFMDGSTALGTGTISNGVATFTTSALSAGNHTITATFAGDSHTSGSSASLSQCVNATGTISGHVYADQTGDGLTADDKLMAGVTVQLFRDMNGNGIFDSADFGVVASMVTTSTGVYNFSGLSKGVYFVQEVLPNGYVRTAPATTSYYTINAVGGTNSTGNDFDNFQICTCVDDLSCYTFIDGCRQFTNLRGNTNAGDTVSVRFTVKAGQRDQFHLVTYTAPDATFNANDAYQQKVYQQAGGTYGAGTYTLTVHIPQGHYQIDFICGSVIYTFGPGGSNIFYTPQGRLISANNG